MVRRIYLLLFGLIASLNVQAQFPYGTTGLLHMPTADMQQEKTFMAGWGYLDKHATPNDAPGWSKAPTMNYYVNITFFPWLEVAYDCTLFRGKYLAEARGYNPKYFKYWANQDRNFSVRLRAWKEGWWKNWTPQIVIGANDALHTGIKNGSGHVGLTDRSNGFWARLYVVATKHFEIKNVATIGAHMAYLHNNRKYFRYEGIGAGVNMQLDGIHTGSTVADELIHGFNFMGEYDTRTINAGLGYSIWKDHINLVGELNDLKYFSGGVYFKVHLK